MKDKALKGLSVCVNYLCNECPYKQYDHPDYPLQCIHKLIEDLNFLYEVNKLQ